MAQKTEWKLPLNEMLKAIDKKDYDWLSRQTPEARKEFKPTSIMRYAASVPNGLDAVERLWLINDRVNPYVWNLPDHPDLLFRLMATCGTGKRWYHEWLPGTSKTTRDTKLSKFMLQYYPEASDSEIELLLSQCTRSSFRDFLDECGTQPPAAKILMEAYDKLFSPKAVKSQPDKK